MNKKFSYILILISLVGFGFVFQVSAAEVCTIQSAKFTPSGTQAKGWYTDTYSPAVRIDVTGTNCADKTVEVSIVEIDSASGISDNYISELNHKPVTFSSNNSFFINLVAGETKCDAFLNIGIDCKYYIKVSQTGKEDFKSDGNAGGNLNYDCDEQCSKDWTVGRPGDTATPAAAPAGGNTSTSTYTYLAPLPGANGALESSIDVANENALGKYLNTIIRLVIGLAAVLAVLMIIMGGMEYIMSEIAHTKQHGKDRITNAVLGLLIALGSWILLNTINPKLLDTNLKIAGTVIEFADEREVIPKADMFEPLAPVVTGAINLCGEGVSRINTSGGNFVVCNRIANGVRTMINSAWSSGYKISGWGWRTMSQQIRLRINHCGGNKDFNIYKKPSKECTPPTAPPGASRHESGLAIDLTCDGVSIQARDNKCFLWLKTNAGRYGLSNLASEPWHWSFDGK
ncbi:MAG: D-alanyl-D-alanine carboxypeptidase family protein [bacterium]|nr:D-alanyl-D-alanine carboxypeptidase family protein [bacterium]